MPTAPTVLIIPGLRDHVEAHWQSLLAASLPEARTVPPLGREDLDCARKVQAIESAVASIAGPVLIVAHSGGCIMVALWARASAQVGRVHAALLATPPDFERPMPEGYPTLAALEEGGWMPVPRTRLPFPSLVAISDNDPLGEPSRVQALAEDWGSQILRLGSVGHLNPASGYGPWPQAQDLIEQLITLN